MTDRELPNTHTGRGTNQYDPLVCLTEPQWIIIKRWARRNPEYATKPDEDILQQAGRALLDFPKNGKRKHLGQVLLPEIKRFFPPAECPGHDRGGTLPPCCDHAGEYNPSYNGDPDTFDCPRNCSCHD